MKVENQDTFVLESPIGSYVKIDFSIDSFLCPLSKSRSVVNNLEWNVRVFDTTFIGQNSCLVCTDSRCRVWTLALKLELLRHQEGNAFLERPWKLGPHTGSLAMVQSRWSEMQMMTPCIISFNLKHITRRWVSRGDITKNDSKKQLMQ